MKKKICSLFLAVFFSALAAAGCAKEPAPPETPTSPGSDSIGAETDEITLDPQLEAEDFGGTFTMFGREVDGYSFPYNELGGNESKSHLDSKIFTRNMNIQSKYSIQLVYKYARTNEMLTKATTALFGGDAYDVILAPTTVSFSMAVNGLLRTLEDMPYINLDKPYYDQSLKTDTSINESHYFVHGHYSISTYNAVAALYLNKTLLQSYDELSDPYELVRSGDWTWSEMFDMCRTVTSVGADLDDPGLGTYGLSVGVYAWQPLFFSSGASLVTKNEEDTPILNLNDCVDLILDINRVLNDSATTFFSSSYQMHSSFNAFGVFGAGRALFMSDPLYCVPEYVMPSEVDYGILPIPKYREKQDNYYSQTHPAHSTVISVMKQEHSDLNKIGKIVEDYAYQSSLHVHPMIVETMIKRHNAQSAQDFEMLEILFSNVRCDMGLSMSNEIKIDSDVRRLFRANDTSIVSTLRTNEPTYRSVLEGIVKSWSQTTN